jgi:hypothetical protein
MFKAETLVVNFKRSGQVIELLLQVNFCVITLTISCQTRTAGNLK